MAPLLVFLWCLLSAPGQAQAQQPELDRSSTGPPTIVIFGASYAQQWGTPNLPGYSRVINRGVGGQETEDMLKRFNRDVIAARPDAVLIWGHANNIVKARPRELRINKAIIEPHYERMIDAAQRAGIEVILATDVPMADADGWLDNLRAWVGNLLGKESYATRISAHIRDVNQQLRSLAAREGLVLLDFERVFANEEGTRKPEYAKPDMSHITAAGYRALSSYAKRELGRPPMKSARVI